MNITLNPELEQLIQSQLTMGEYNTIEDLLKEALINLLERKKHQSLSKKVNNLFNQTQSLANKQEITEEDIIAEIEAYRRGAFSFFFFQQIKICCYLNKTTGDPGFMIKY